MTWIAVKSKRKFDIQGMSDIMSDMQTFTVRELDRQPGKILSICDREGRVRIRRRDGQAYLMYPEPLAAAEIGPLPDFAARRRSLSARILSEDQERKVDQAIRGE